MPLSRSRADYVDRDDPPELIWLAFFGIGCAVLGYMLRTAGW